jgi:hypothetical protein
MYLYGVDVILIAECLQQDNLYMKGCIALAALRHDAEEDGVRAHF